MDNFSKKIVLSCNFLLYFYFPQPFETNGCVKCLRNNTSIKSGLTGHKPVISIWLTCLCAVVELAAYCSPQFNL